MVQKVTTLKGKILAYINPVTRLGNKHYSFLFPLFTNLAAVFLSEFFVLSVLKNPDAVGSYIIFVNVALIIYFAFRDGIRGGFISTVASVGYYFYIIERSNLPPDRFRAAVETTLVLGVLYLFLGTVIGWLKQTIDTLIGKEIDSREIAEEGQVQLQTVLQQLPVGVLLADAENGVLDGNKQVKKILGKKLPPRLEMNSSYRAPNVFVDNRTVPQREWPIVRALQKGETITAEEMEFVRDDGVRLFLRVNAAPIKSKDGKILAAVSTIDDITHEKELEQRKDDFVNMASHELKTPITSMKLYIELLLGRVKKEGDEKSIRLLTSIKNQTGRLQELTNDLLDVSRIQTGKLHFQKEECRIDTLIEDTIEVLQPTTQTHTIVFIGKKHIKIHADKFRIYQVLTNLITNAIKYSPEGKEIRIQAKKDGDKALVSVQDFGIGISKKLQKKVFERLYQVADPGEKTYPGLGMGLYISKEIVTRHKGKIWVEGDKDKGSTFFFTIPLHKEA